MYTYTIAADQPWYAASIPTTASTRRARAIVGRIPRELSLPAALDLARRFRGAVVLTSGRLYWPIRMMMP